MAIHRGGTDRFTADSLEWTGPDRIGRRLDLLPARRRRDARLAVPSGAEGTSGDGPRAARIGLARSWQRAGAARTGFLAGGGPCQCRTVGLSGRRDRPGAARRRQRTGTVAHGDRQPRPETGQQPHPLPRPAPGFSMPGALSDILSAQQDSVFMRHLRFTLDGSPAEKAIPHLHSPAGFLDDSWWHRTYWIVGSEMHGGWGSWPNMGMQVPSGRLLVVWTDRRSTDSGATATTATAATWGWAAPTTGCLPGNWTPRLDAPERTKYSCGSSQSSRSSAP
jgi:hypothetical protein